MKHVAFIAFVLVQPASVAVIAGAALLIWAFV